MLYRPQYPIKVLSLWQPWATLVAEGLKWIETRGKPAPYGYVGQTIAIHATMRQPKSMYDAGLIADRHGDGSWWLRVERSGISLPMPLGAILCTVTLDANVSLIGEHETEPDCPNYIADLPADMQFVEGLWLIGPHHSAPTIVEDQRPYGDFTAGRYGYLFSNLHKIDVPVPFVGGMGWSKSWDGK